MGGKKIENPPDALLLYELCSKFKVLPSQLYAEDNKTIEEFIVILNAINEYENKQTRKENRKELAKKHGVSQPRG